MTLEQAYKIAKENKGKINNYQETEDAFIFGDTTENTDGGYDSGPVVIMKATGKAYCFVYYLQNMKPVIRAGSI